jgi:hypothetical protein
MPCDWITHKEGGSPWDKVTLDIFLSHYLESGYYTNTVGGAESRDSGALYFCKPELIRNEYGIF